MTRRTGKDGRQPSEPRKRFRIEKLEERIAPAKGGKGTKNCGGGGDSSQGSGFISASTTPTSIF